MAPVYHIMIHCSVSEGLQYRVMLDLPPCTLVAIDTIGSLNLRLFTLNQFIDP